jgi:hypothetical protein
VSQPKGSAFTLGILTKGVSPDIMILGEDQGMIEPYILDYLIRIGLIFAGVCVLVWVLSGVFGEEE